MSYPKVTGSSPVLFFLFLASSKYNRKVRIKVNVQLFWKRHASTILTVAGGVGVIATTVTAIKATPKALEALEEAKENKGEELTQFEQIKIAGPKYIPTVLIGASTIACIFGANVLNKRHQAALVSAYTLIDSSFKEYKQKLKELYGEETHNNIIDALAIEGAKEVGITAGSLGALTCLTDEEACGEPVLFYEEFSGRYFESTIEQVIAAVYHFNRNFVLRGYSTLNELYYFLGLEPTDYGSELGWAVEDGLYWVDFNNRKALINDELECYILETPWEPSADFKEYYY